MYTQSRKLDATRGRLSASPLFVHQAAVRKLHFSQDGQLLLSVGSDGACNFFNSTGEQIATLAEITNTAILQDALFVRNNSEVMLVYNGYDTSNYQAPSIKFIPFELEKSLSFVLSRKDLFIFENCS